MALPTLLLTRPLPSAQAFVATLDSAALASVRLVMAPLMKIISIQTSLNLDGASGVIFTSINGVSHASEGMGRVAFCVGSQTTRQARLRGWNAQLAGNNALELIAMLRAKRPFGRLLHLGGEHTIGDIAQVLTADGIETQHVSLYRQQLLSLSEEALEALNGPSIVPVFSARTATQLAAEAHGNLGSAHIIALSDSVAAPFAGEKMAHCLILPSPQAIYMRKAVETLCLNISLA